jgi:hypothetical protein
MPGDRYPWTEAPSRRNDGRLAVFIIKSDMIGGNEGLAAYSNLTREFLTEEAGITENGWPTDLVALLEGDAADRLWLVEDDRGRAHRMAMVRFDWGDVYWGLGSRQESNVAPNPTQNAMSNHLITVMKTRSPGDHDTALYGYAVALEHSRFWRAEAPGAAVQAVMRDWEIVVHTGDLHLDFRAPRSSQTAVEALAEAAEEARRMKKKFSRHRNNSQANGKSKWSRKTVSAIISVHPETGAMSYDRDACDAIRDAVRLRVAGLDWDSIAFKVGGRIPSYRLQSEPDIAPIDAERSRQAYCRSARNAWRKEAGRPVVPLRLLPSGRPNPDYQPESLLDQKGPGHALRALLVEPIKPPARDRQAVLSRVGTDLGGISPSLAVRELFTRGIYRRLVLNQALSNSEVRRYMWVSTELGRYDVEGYLVSDADYDVLERRLGGVYGTGSALLTDVFRVEQTESIYTDTGLIEPTPHGWRCDDRHGELRFRVSGCGSDSGHWFGFEPLPGPARGRGSERVAFVRAKDLERSVCEAILDGVDFFDPALAEYLTVDAGGAVESRARREAEARRELDQAEETYRALVVGVERPGISSERRRIIEEELESQEGRLAGARARMLSLEGDGRRPTANFDLTKIADVLALCYRDTPLPGEVVKRVRQLLRSWLTDGAVRLDVARNRLEWSATLRLTGDRGHVMRVPIAGSVPNRRGTPWTGGDPWAWWTSCRPLPDIFERQRPRPSWATRQERKQMIVARLLETCDRWRGPNAVEHFLNCPFKEVTSAGRMIAMGELHEVHPEVFAAVERLFFAPSGGPGQDLPGRQSIRWSQPMRATEEVHRAVRLARGEAPEAVVPDVPGQTMNATVRQAVRAFGDEEFNLRELCDRVPHTSIVTARRTLLQMKQEGSVVKRMHGRIGIWRRAGGTALDQPGLATGTNVSDK